MLHKEPDKLLIYSDGASRGNPGPAAAAFKILDKRGILMKSSTQFLGRRTNNEAEYEALIFALKETQNFTKELVHCFLDSELVVKQLNGEYQVLNPRLEVLWLKVRELQQKFRNVSFSHVSRSNINIKEVDRLANRVLAKMDK